MKRLLTLPALLLALAGCGLSTGYGSAGSPSPTATPSSWPAGWVLPNQSMSPGAIGTTDITRLCPHVDPALEAARPDSSQKAAIYRAYGLSYPQAPGAYELDHIVPIELGGAPDDPENLYPEPNAPADPATERKYHLSPAFVHNPKDILEDVLHQDVCSGGVALSVAQQAMASDWRLAYIKYVGPPPSE